MDRKRLASSLKPLFQEKSTYFPDNTLYPKRFPVSNYTNKKKITELSSDKILTKPENHSKKHISPLSLQTISTDIIQAQYRRQKPSKIVPELDDSTVSEMKNSIRYGKSKKIRQELIDYIVGDRSRKGDDFKIMEKGKPVYLDKNPDWIPESHKTSNGLTIPPGQKEVCTGKKPCVFILKPAFSASTSQESIVRLYSTIMHEFHHTKQWQNPIHAKSLGKSGRETDAYLTEINNSQNSGLANQKQAFRNVWEETKTHWKNFKASAEWKNLKKTEQESFTSRYQKALKKANEILK